jgi:rod shape determining protein RodA
MPDLSRIQNFNNRFILNILCLCVIGGLTIFSTTYFGNQANPSAFRNQIIFYLLGAAIFFLISLTNYKLLKSKISIGIISLLSLSLLALVLFIGVSAGEAQRWISIGDFTIQPSEFAKIAVIIITAFGFSSTQKSKYEEIYNIYEFHKTSWIQKIRKNLFSGRSLKMIFLFVFLATALTLVFLQKSLGNTILIFLTFGLMAITLIPLQLKYGLYLISGLVGAFIGFGWFTGAPLFQDPNNSNILILGGVTALIVVLSRILNISTITSLILFAALLLVQPLGAYFYENNLSAYQRNRVETFLNPSENINFDQDWNRQKSIEAIGDGEFSGKGFLQGVLVNRGLLPYSFTDFAFAAYAEQFGFIGSILLMGLYLFLLIQILSISAGTKSLFGKLLCTGVAALIFLNSVQHIGMNLGMVPISGVPLPLISYGGSSILTIFIGLGIVHSVYLGNLEKSRNVVRLG